MNRLTLVFLLGALLVVSTISMIEQTAKTAEALSAVSFTQRNIISSDSSDFDRVYYNSTNDTIYFLDVDSTNRIKQDSYNASSHIVGSLTYPHHAGVGNGSPADSTKSPGTLADDAAVGTVAWSNTANAAASDNTYATTGILAGSTSHYLKAKNFGFSVPSDATINGIIVKIEKKKTGTGIGIQDSAVKIVKSDGSIGTQNKADTVTDWPASDTYASYGSSTDKWGESWTAADINDADFGVVLSAFGEAGNPNIANVDHISITVYYTVPVLISTTEDVHVSDVDEDGTFFAVGRNSTSLVNNIAHLKLDSTVQIANVTVSSNYIPIDIVQSTNKIYTTLMATTTSGYLPPSSATASSTSTVTQIASTTTTVDGGLNDATFGRFEKITATGASNGKPINVIKVDLKKSGSPTGTLTAGVFDSSGNLIKSFGTLSVSTLTTSYTTQTFSLVASCDFHTIATNDYVGVKYTTGTSSNFVEIKQDNGGAYDSTNSVLSALDSSNVMSDFSTLDLTITAEYQAEACYAKDASTVSFWRNNVNNEAGANIYADLGSSKEVSGVKLYFSDTSEIPQTLDIYVSDSNVVWGTPDDTWTPSQTAGYQERSFAAISGRYVKLEVDTWGTDVRFRLADFQIGVDQKIDLYLAAINRDFTNYDETSIYNGTAAVPVDNAIVRSVVVNDGASELVYIFFLSNSTNVRAVKFATATQTPTILSTAMSADGNITDFQVIPLSGKIIVTAGQHVWELDTSTNTISQLLVEHHTHSHEDTIVPDDIHDWITQVPQTFTISTSARTYVDTNLPYLASTKEAYTFTPSIGAGPSAAGIFIETADRGLDNGTLYIYSPAKYYHFTGLDLVVESATEEGTTWTIKSIGAQAEIAIDAHHEFLESVEPDPFGPYEGVHFIYCDFLNWNMTVPRIIVSEYDDCTAWHTFSQEFDPAADPNRRALFPFSPSVKPVHAFTYTVYTFDMTANKPENYKVVTKFNDIIIDNEQFDITGIAQQRWFEGNCYRVEIIEIATNKVVFAGTGCANGILAKTLTLETVTPPENVTGSTWEWSIQRDFDVPENNTITFTIEKNTKPFNVNIYFTDHFLDSYKTYDRWMNFTGATGPVAAVVNGFTSNQTIYITAYENGKIVINAISSAAPPQIGAVWTTAFGGAKLFGVPVEMIFPIALAVAFPRSLAHIGIIVVAGTIGVMGIFGMLDTSLMPWNLIPVFVALGVFAAKRYFG